MVQSLVSAARVSAVISCGNFVGRDRHNPDAAERDDWKRDRVVAREYEKCFRHSVDRFRNLGHVAAGFLHAHDVGNLGEARQGCGFEVRSGTSGHVVENDRLVADRLRDRFEMPILALLRGLVVVGRRGEDVINAGPRGNLFRLFDGIVRSVGRSSGDDGDASGGDFDRHVDDVQPFVVGESRSLARGTAGN